MRFKMLMGWFLSIGMWNGFAWCDDAATTAKASSPRVDFLRDVEPLLTSRCLKCHGNDGAEAGLRLTHREAALNELSSGARAIVPGKPTESELLVRVASTDENLRMPPNGPPLSAAEQTRLKRWIEEGAEWPLHWAYRPLVRPAIPEPSEAKNREWRRTPVDRFIAAERERMALDASPEADRRTLLRRASFDVLGLPPTDEELRSFELDTAPDAYERRIDQLLANPHYGERWARHWMDLVHYAETHGNDQDRPRENAWPYRDYLIRSLNEDKPYARFVQEQIAGDVMFPEDPSAIAATGFLATGPWDESSLRDIQENTLDREIARTLDRDDIVTTVMSTFVSSTVHCARCHDHKFDPISQREYYALQSVFAGIDKANRAYDRDPALAARRRALEAELKQLPDRRDEEDPSLLSPELLADLKAWETSVRSSASLWTLMTPSELSSAEGVTLTRLEDGSILSEGAHPDKDVYTFVAEANLKSVSGLRLEVLTHDSLPHRGPGRQNNGNLHLNEIDVTAIPKGRPDQERKIVLQNPRADFNQKGWTIDHAIDGNAGSAWGIHPEVGKPHHAHLEFQTPHSDDSGIVLKIKLHQAHGGGHLIGRFRLLATSAARPLPADAEPLPARIASFLAIPSSERSDAQTRDLIVHLRERQIRAALDALPKQQFVYAGTNRFQPDGSFRPTTEPRPIHLLNRGENAKPGPVVEPGALSCVPELDYQLPVDQKQNEGARRAALARWVADPRNVLTWRSIVNRLWQYHFGRGLVDSPSDFGRMGSPPSHPELLDWLACELRDSGGSLKSLHRTLLTSAVYRQSSGGELDAASLQKSEAIDADNRWLWRMNRQRLDAESIRDATLVLSGQLDTRMEGPSVRQFVQSPGVHVTPKVDYAGFDVDDPANRRRSVYRFVFRTLPDPFMEALDCPDASQWTPRRTTSVTALQALAMWNDKFVMRQSQHLADRIVQSASGSRDEETRVAIRLVFGRDPGETEARSLRRYVDQHGWANACRVLLNSNEFLFVD